MLNINKINKKLHKVYGDKVIANVNYDNHSIVVSGKLDNWKDIVKACKMAVYNKDQYHVVNKIELEGVSIPSMKLPDINDNSLDNSKVDVLIIGAGISGASIARELSRYKLDILLVDKESDLAMHSSGRNDGEVHPGVDQSRKSIKLKYELKANRSYDKTCEELGVPFKWRSQYVAFKNILTLPLVCFVVIRSHLLGIDDTKLVSKKHMYEVFPNLTKECDFGLYNKYCGVVDPFQLTVAYAENAVSNGAHISLNTAVLGMEVNDGKIISVKTNRGTIYPKIVINAAGTFADVVADMAKDQFFSIHPRKGVISIVDKKKKDLTIPVISFRNILKMDRDTKGGGIVRTTHDNILVGPTADETYMREDFSTSVDGITPMFNKQRKAIPSLNERDIITYFAGVRAPSFEEDFIIEKGRMTNNIIHCAAIQSPGLTAAPAFSKDVASMAAKMLDAKVNEAFNPIRKAYPILNEMSDEQRSKMIKENPLYGHIVCRCEEISEGEIIDVLNSPICVPTIDAIKKRIRPGMGRCQGGFCSPFVSSIIAKNQKLKISEVTKKGNKSLISYGETK